MLSLSRVWSRRCSDINTWVVLECTLSSLCKYRSLRLGPIHFKRWHHHILNHSTAVNAPILIIYRMFNIPSLVLMIHKLSIVSWLLLHKHVAITFIEDLGVRVEHEALIVGVGVAWDGETSATIAHEHEKRWVWEANGLLRDVLFTPLWLQTRLRRCFLRASFSLKLGLRTDSLRCQVHFRWGAHRLSSGVGFLRPPWVTQMIRIVI